MGMTYPKPKGGPPLTPRPEREPADAVTGCSVRPELILPEVYGHHRSEVRRDGNRHWWFTDPRGRDQFRKDFKSRLVKGS
jgi:hypothetical protein